MSGLFRKSGGGFLHGTTGVIAGYKFGSKTFETTSKKAKNKTYDRLSVELTIQPDGAEETLTTFLDAGFIYEGQSISEDGQTLESADERPIIGEDTEFAQFIESMLENEGPEAELIALEGRNYAPIVGLRVTFAKVIDEVRQLASGRNKLGAKAKTATKEELMEAGKQVDKKDKTKSYNHQLLRVSAVLGKGEVKAVAGKKASAPKPAAATKKTAAATTDEQPSVDLVIALLADADGNTLEVGKLSSVITKYALSNGIEKADREAHNKLIRSEAFLSNERGWSYDAKAKTISLA